jgi:hypothetical protein
MSNRTVTISLRHPSVRLEKLVGRKAEMPSGRVGTIERDPMGGPVLVVGFPDKTWVPVETLVKLVVEEN